MRRTPHGRARGRELPPCPRASDEPDVDGGSDYSAEPARDTLSAHHRLSLVPTMRGPPSRTRGPRRSGYAAPRHPKAIEFMAARKIPKPLHNRVGAAEFRPL
jgi:hypothetical protein